MDDVTYEIAKHRLWEINNEIGILAARMAASPIVYEVGDYNTGILNAAGKGVISGVGVIRMATALDLVVQAVNQTFAGSIGPGDVFVTNDPFAGALHAMDLAVVAPLFVGDQLLSWTGIVFHELDMGGPTPGGFSVGATDAFQEAPLIPPMKLVDAGVVRPDVEATLLRNSRMPDAIGINVHARIGAQSLAHDRIRELIDTIGVNTYIEVQERILADVRDTVKHELRRIPDGEWEVSTHLDHDGVTEAIYELKLKATKRGEKLTLDFRGTSAQARGSINCPWSGLVAGTLAALVPVFCIDVPWAHGAVYDCIEIISDEGTINNATHPAATSMATIHACSSTTDLVLDVLARMSYWVPERRDEVLSLGAAGQNSGIVTGRHGNGDPFLMMFPGMGGGPARFEVDGIDTNGHQMGAPIFAIPNVETLESRTSTLFVWRRESRDSAGPGQWRGGTGIEFAITPHRSAAALDLIVFSTHRRSPASRGVFGGMPAALQTNVIRRGIQPMSFVEGRDAPLPADLQLAAVEVLPGKARVALDHGDIWISSQSGGGGFGDPLFRDPEAVVRDLRDGICSPEFAERHHGVVLAGDVLDIMATDALRRARLAERRSGGPPDHTDKPIIAEGVYSNRHGTKLLSCHDCGAAFEIAGEVEGAPAVVVPWDLQAATTINKWATDSIFLVEMYCCPGCGRCHDSGVSLRQPRDQNVAWDF